MIIVDVINNITCFSSRIWQIHPFREDNTFLIKFYEDLLLGKNNNLHSKDLIVDELFNKVN